MSWYCRFFSCGNDDSTGIDTPPSNPELMVAEDALFVRIGEDTGAERKYYKVVENTTL